MCPQLRRAKLDQAVWSGVFPGMAQYPRSYININVKVKLLAKIDIVNRQTQRLLGTLLE